MSPYAVDTLCSVVAFTLPAYVVFRSRRVLPSILLGTAIVWITLIVAGEVLSGLDPRRDAAMLDSVWLLFGWLDGLIYCLVLYGLKRFLLFVYHRLVRVRRRAESGQCEVGTAADRREA